MGAMHELKGHVEAQGIQCDVLQIGAAFLALARAKGWTQDSTTLVSWLEDLALEVAKGWHGGESRPGANASESEIDTVPLTELRKALKEARARKNIDP